MSKAQTAEDTVSSSTATVDMDELTALCKRRGFVFRASDIYDGINGFWDYGPLGTQLKNNLRDWWWQDMVIAPPLGPDGEVLDIVGIDSSIIQNPRTWEASGHLAGFSDPMRKCPDCGHFVRGDHLWDILATDCAWLSLLLQEFTPVTGEIDTPRLLKWAQTKGKKLAPNLALVKNPEVTLSFLATRVNGQPDAPPDMMELTRYLATGQMHETGLQDPCPLCGGALSEPVEFTLMFETSTGIEKSSSNKVYLRPETAQGIFLNYRNVLSSARVRPPFGIAQIGKAFRNEVTPRNFIYRSREFEQMEMEWFCHPDEAKKWLDFWIEARKDWWAKIGIRSNNLLIRPHEKDELSHYAKEGYGTVDVEYRFPFTAPGFGELEGIAHRCDFDLKQHEEHSGTKMAYVDPQAPDDRYIPHVIEPAAGLTRGVLAVLADAYTPDPSRPSKMFMKFHPKLAPVKAAVLPLLAKDGLPEIAQKLYMSLRGKFMTEMDVKQNIGKRYARHDEIGTPFCLTIDTETPEDQAVTIRDRDTMAQERVSLDNVDSYLSEKLL
ncbi:MAG: glycine--tRNA ligase [Micavibrio sp.]|nr:MAG: glycine--tRNA ligase [Micavibrio sp.]